MRIRNREKQRKKEFKLQEFKNTFYEVIGGERETGYIRFYKTLLIEIFSQRFNSSDALLILL